MFESELLYLSRSDVEAVGLPMTEVIDAVEAALRELGLGRATMPAKTRLSPDPTRYYSAMPAVLPGAGVAAVKWNSISSRNPARGLPFIVGLLILNDDETGLPLAVMDSSWITAKRTAAASAVTARYLLGRPLTTLGVCGCGVQGRAHAEALLAMFPSLRRVRAYDIDPDALASYAVEVQRAQGVEVVPCPNPRAAVAGADAVITATPTTSRAEALEAAWLEAGQLVVSIDYDCFWKADALRRLDLAFTDDLAQFEKSRQYGYYKQLPGVAGDIPGVVAGRTPGRRGPDQVIASFNAGVAVEDVATAARIYRLAREKGIGTRLRL